jgi:hypothetical protein
MDGLPLSGSEPFGPTARPPVALGLGNQPAPAQAPSPALAASLNAPAPGPQPVKSAADYLRALRRRVWLVLLVALPISAAGAVWALRQPPVYRTSAQILIEPPQFDTILSGLVGHSVPRHDAESSTKYVPNQLARLRSKAVADRVVSTPALMQQGGGGDPAQELIGGIQTRQLTGSNYVDVTLEGRDSRRITTLLNTHLSIFKDDADGENRGILQRSRRYGQDSIDALKKELDNIDKNINRMISKSSIFAPGGKNLLQQQYTDMNVILIQKRNRHDELRHQQRIADLMPNLRRRTAPSPYESKVAEIQRERKYLATQMAHLGRTIRNMRTDPAAVGLSRRIALLDDELRQMRGRSPPSRPSPTSRPSPSSPRRTRSGASTGRSRNSWPGSRRRCPTTRPT